MKYVSSFKCEFHSSEIRGLHSTKVFSETFRNLLYVFISIYSEVARNEKKCPGVSYTYSIAKFDAIRWKILLSTNLLFMKSDLRI